MEEVIIPRDADSHVALTGDFRVARAAFEEARLAKARTDRDVQDSIAGGQSDEKLIPTSSPVPTSAEKKQHYCRGVQCRPLWRAGLVSCPEINSDPLRVT